MRWMPTSPIRIEPLLRPPDRPRELAPKSRRAPLVQAVASLSGALDADPPIPQASVPTKPATSTHYRDSAWLT
jgi:hypothetical protein